jgi:hypothetical protein
MTQTAELIETETTALAVININPVAVYTNAEAFDEYLARVRKKVTEGFTPDLTTDKGRKAIASQAFVVTKEKTALVAAGKKLTEDARAMIKSVTEARNGMEERLDALAKEVRRPLTEWEEREAARVKRCEDAIKQLRAHAVISFDETAASVQVRWAAVNDVVIDAAEFGEFLDMAEQLKASALDALDAGFKRLTKEEADRAELEALRAAKAEQERIAAEQAAEAERVRLEAEAVEQRRVEAEEREAARVAAEKRRADEIAAAAEKARLDAIAQAEADAAAELAAAEAKAAAELAAAEAKAAQELADQQAAHKAKLDQIEAERAEERRIAKAAEDKREAERIAKERAEQAAADLAEKTRREDEARTADRVHRSNVLKAAKEALIAQCDIDEPTAKKIVIAIMAGEIPAISIKF